MTRLAKCLSALALGCAIASPACATTIDGFLGFGGGGTNFFDPVNGDVPGGFGNSSSPNGVAVGAGVEFGFNDNATLIRADFTSTSLTLTDLCELAGGCHDASVHLVFTASTPGFFSNFQGVGGINDFPGTKNASVTGAGDTLTLDWGGADPVAFNVTFDANFTFGSTSATPLPATLPLFAGGAGLIGLLARRRKQKRAA